MAISMTITSIEQRDDAWHVTFNNRLTMTFQSVSAARDYVRDTLSEETCKAILAAKALSLANPINIVGRTLTADLSQNQNIVRIV